MMLVDGQSRLAGLLRDISNTTLIINCNLVDWDQGGQTKSKKSGKQVKRQRSEAEMRFIPVTAYIACLRQYPAYCALKLCSVQQCADSVLK